MLRHNDLSRRRTRSTFVKNKSLASFSIEDYRNNYSFDLFLITCVIDLIHGNPWQLRKMYWYWNYTDNIIWSVYYSYTMCQVCQHKNLSQFEVKMYLDFLNIASKPFKLKRKSIFIMCNLSKTIPFFDVRVITMSCFYMYSVTK